MKRFDIAALIFTFAIASAVAKADQPRRQYSFASVNGQYEARCDNREWRVIEKNTEKELYRFSDYHGERVWFSSMTMVVSNDGRSIAIVDDYSEQDFDKNPEVLFFLRDGKKIKAYRLKELSDPRFLSVSVSHFDWVGFPKPLTTTNSTFELVTLELKHVTFNVENGELLRSELDKDLADNAVFVFGLVRGIDKKHSEITVRCTIRGDIKKGTRLQFESDDFRWIGGGHHQALIVRNGKLVKRVGTLFNLCQ